MLLRKSLHYHPMRRAFANQVEYLSRHRSRWDESETMIDRYLERIVEYRSRIDIAEFPKLPFVAIGSKVRYIETDTNRWSQMSLCYPEDEREEWGMISFASPNGRKLLLRQVDDVLLLDGEGGPVRVCIRSIECTGQLAGKGSLE